MRTVSTRSRILIATILLPGVYVAVSLALLLYPAEIPYQTLIAPITVGILQSMLTAWIVHFNLKGERMFAVLVFPALSLGILVGFLNRLITAVGSEIDRYIGIFILSIILAAVVYIISANINILNLAAQRPLPLAQAAKAAHYIATMIFSYFGFVLIVSSTIPILLKPLLAALMVFSYSYIALWTIRQEYRAGFLSSISMSLLLGFAYLVLSLWPLASFYMALFLVLMFYMSLGVALEIREMINKWVWYEYTAIFLVMILILLSTASWGVNGTIL